MFSVTYTNEQLELKEELVSARKCFSDALDRYAALCSTIRRSHPPESFGSGEKRKDALPWSGVLEELLLLPNFEMKILEAKRDLTRVRDLGWANDSDSWLSSVTRPRIVQLPHEILVRIFQFVQAIDPCNLATLGNHQAAYPRYPDYLAQVCTPWHNIALACPSLWTHIDLVSHPKYFGSLLGRALVHSRRADQLPLEIHIRGTEDLASKAKAGLWWFTDSIASRVKSLEVCHGTWYFGGLETEVFGLLLQGCPETFNRLIVTVHPNSPSRPAFFRSTKDRDHWDTKNIRFPLSQKQIEHGLAHLTILHASGTFADWNSVAYHGLVDLRLTPGCEKWDASIKECDLVAILKASPGLRIFHFALQLKKVSPIDSSVQPIVLNDLEVLDVSAYSNSHPRDTLPEVASAIQLITPGSKSLRLTIQTNNYTGLPALDAVKQFFLRSRISKFCTRKGCPPPCELLLCAPDLVQLVFDRCTYSAQFNQEQMDQNHISDSPLRLYSWHIRGSSIYLDDFHSLIRQYPTRSLVISQCRVYRRTGAPEELPRVALSVHLPGTRFVTQEDLQPDPTADWNDLD